MGRLVRANCVNPFLATNVDVLIISCPLRESPTETQRVHSDAPHRAETIRDVRYVHDRGRRGDYGTSGTTGSRLHWLDPYPSNPELLHELVGFAHACQLPDDPARGTVADAICLFCPRLEDEADRAIWHWIPPLRQAIAIVCAPNQDPSFGLFRLTDPPGLQTIVQVSPVSVLHAHMHRPASRVRD